MLVLSLGPTPFAKVFTHDALVGVAHHGEEVKVASLAHLANALGVEKHGGYVPKGRVAHVYGTRRIAILCVKTSPAAATRTTSSSTYTLTFRLAHMLNARASTLCNVYKL